MPYHIIIKIAQGSYELTVHPTRDWVDLDVKTLAGEMQPLRWENGELRSRRIKSLRTQASNFAFDLIGTEWEDFSDDLYQVCMTALEECALLDY